MSFKDVKMWREDLKKMKLEIADLGSLEPEDTKEVREIKENIFKLEHKIDNMIGEMSDVIEHYEEKLNEVM